MKKNIRLILTIFSIVIISTISFFIYFTIRQGISDIFIKYGLTNYYLQAFVAIFALLLLLVVITMLVGKKLNFWRLLKDIFQT